MSKQLGGLAWGRGGGTKAEEAPLLEIKGAEFHPWAFSLAAGSGGMGILGSAASIEMHSGRMAVCM